MAAPPAARSSTPKPVRQPISQSSKLDALLPSEQPKLKLKALSDQPERQLESGLTEHEQNESDKSNKSYDPYKWDKQDEPNEQHLKYAKYAEY